METNILGLPSFTGYTPLKAAQQGQVLKYDFKGIGPRVIDKSGNGNNGNLKPMKDPPRRKIQRFFPLEMALKLDGENDYVEVPYDESFKFGEGNFTVEARFRILENPSAGQGIVTDHDGVTQMYGLAAVPGPEIRATIRDQNGNRAVLTKPVSVGDTVPAKMVRRDGSLELWLHGEKVGTADATGVGNLNNGNPLLIGHESEDVPKRFLNAEIEYVRIYDRAI